ncbi:MAG: VCBS repeat-containing protein, partial [Bacteroidales bacterium]
MKTKLTTILTVTFLFILSPIFGQWPKCVVDNNSKTVVTVDIGDVDGDNQPDIVAAAYGNTKLLWYKNNYPNWTPHTIDSTGILNDLTFAWFADVNVDGKLDVVANFANSKRLVWYENNHPDWIEHSIDNTTDNADFMIVADINGNDTMDVVTAGSIAQCKLVWYENKYPDWIPHYIDSRWDKYSGATVSDFDGDGLLDVGVVIYEANKVVWYKNEDNGDSWTQNIIDDKLEGSIVINSGDIDGDDRIDIVASSGSYYFEEGGDMIWYKNQPDGWIQDTIDHNQDGFYPSFSDVNGDGNMDIVASVFSVFKAQNVCWYEYNNTIWIKHVIDEDMPGLRAHTIKDIDGDNIDDLVVAGGNSIAWYKNPFTTVAFAESMEISASYVQSLSDTLTVRASVSNPENHAANVIAIIRNEQSVFIDSLQLFDDGLHIDGDSSDNIWGNKISLSGLPEDKYIVELVTHDLISGNAHYYHSPYHFTTIGPINVDDYIFTSSDTIFNPGDNLRIYLTLKNNSPTATATNIGAKLFSLDTLATVETTASRSFGDITAGETSKSSGTYSIKIAEECPFNIPISIMAEITSDGYAFWTDTFTLMVLEPVNIEDITEPVTRIYPNPTNNILNIEISKTGRHALEIE